MVILGGGNALTTNVNEIILVGVVSSALVAANFSA
jgi:hypothetical protein